MPSSEQYFNLLHRLVTPSVDVILGALDYFFYWLLCYFKIFLISLKGLTRTLNGFILEIVELHC